MLNKDYLTLICKESFKCGMKCLGEVDGEKVYRMEYETTSYYVDDTCNVLYIVYNDDFNDYEVEYLDLGMSVVMKYLKALKEDF